MKRVFIIILMGIGVNTFSQNTYVPDDNFEQALINLGYDSGPLDNYVPTSNIDSLVTFNVSSKNIVDLTGIEDFIALEDLNCSFNQLTGFDISALTNLNRLDCYSNPLTSIDISSNTALTYFSCGESDFLTNLDISANTNLAVLICEFCPITSLDVSANTALTGLFCYGDQLLSLDVSANTELTSISCGGNQLADLNLSTNTELSRIYCYENQLTSLDVRNGNNENIIYFEAYSNPGLQCILVDDKNATYLEDWKLDPESAFVNNEQECGVTSHTYIPDVNFEQALIDLGYDTGPPNNYVPTSNIEGISTLFLLGKNIDDLTGIEDFTALSYFDCWGNNLTNLDLASNTNLTYLNCNSNQLTNLDVTANTELEELFCGNNQLTNLDVSSNTELVELFCFSNQLTSLDLSSNFELKRLQCSDNDLISLDLSKNSSLYESYCSYNQLEYLDLRNGSNEIITHFSAANNLDLKCIYVDNKYEPLLSSWLKDPSCLFVNNEDECNGIPQTYVPDDNFEQALIDLGHDTGILNNNIPTENINGVALLDITSKNIVDLTGIEDFVSLQDLLCPANDLVLLDLSSNSYLTYLDCSNNHLSGLEIRNGNNAEIEYVNSNNNPSLLCIFVDDKEATYLLEWEIDSTSTFVETEAECDVLGINKIAENNGISIYPNPTDGIIYIDFTAEHNNNRLIISDITGKPIKEKSGIQQNVTIDLTGFKTGIYIINIQTEKEIFSSKIIKR